jgi:hypothetical protein
VHVEGDGADEPVYLKPFRSNHFTGETQYPTLRDADIQERAYDLPRIRLLGT